MHFHKLKKKKVPKVFKEKDTVKILSELVIFKWHNISVYIELYMLLQFKKGFAAFRGQVRSKTNFINSFLYIVQNKYIEEYRTCQ